MEAITTKLVIAGLLFLSTILSGIWISSTGRPFNLMIFTIHKLLSLATVFLVAMSVYNLFKVLELRSIFELAVIVSTGMIFLTLMITGALLSRNIVLPEAILRVHQLAPLLALVFSTITIFLLIRTKS